MKIRFLALSQVMFLALLFFVCTQKPFEHPAAGWGHMMGYGGYGGILVGLILLILAGAVIYFVFAQGERNQNVEGKWELKLVAL